MKKWNFSWAIILGLSLTGSGNALSVDGGYVGYHQDYRTTPKLKLNLNYSSNSFSGSDVVAIAKDYIAAAKSEYLWDESHLELMKVRQSLAGAHVHFQQMRDGHPVRSGEVIVSVDKKTNSVYQVFNNYYPGETPKSRRAVMSKDAVFDLAWQDLKVHGKLQGEPKAELMYVVNGKGRFNLAYVTMLNVDAPFGAWEHVIDARTGKILQVSDTRLERKQSDMAAMRSMYKGPTADRTKAFNDYAAKAAQLKSKAALRRVDGSGLVFDPDPRTTLSDSSLQDTSPASMFDDAYFTRALKDLTFDGTNYSLKGPWVTLADFESPAVAPSTTTDGHWSATRGDVAFNDVMTYFHLDQSQRYMQSLGFVGDRAIQGVSIEVDANGLSGQDNSHYIPSSNRLAFGHGCVDDNEDADVILHEYGHAINYSINSNWGGGDSGAMGEGFGDYWAGSYSVSTTNGLDYQPENVFTWDAHGDGSECWPGRILNALTLEYDHDRTYGAHSAMPGNRQTDELWSTPLFQSLLALMEMGVARNEVDQIILEAQFGLGSGLKMRDLANSIINTAKRLYPDGPHASVFFEKFSHHNIVDAPRAVLELGNVNLMGTGSNGVVDPGESISLSVALNNRGTLEASGVEAVLSTGTGLVDITTPSSRYAQIDAGAAVINESPFTLVVDPSFQCGDKIDLNLAVNFEGGASTSATLPIQLSTGVPRGASATNNEAVAIPDDNEAGATSIINVGAEGTVTSEFMIDIVVEHTYISDLRIVLTSPAGTEVVLHANSGGGDSNIEGTYPATLTPAQALSLLAGEPLAGEWKLSVVDSAGQDTGSLKSWGIRDISGYDCQ